jgi:hypothetical protein
MPVPTKTTIASYCCVRVLVMYAIMIDMIVMWTDHTHLRLSFQSFCAERVLESLPVRDGKQEHGE